MYLPELFRKCVNAQEVKKTYHDLAMQFHPDRPQNRNRQTWANEKMKDLNAQYHQALKVFSAQSASQKRQDENDQRYEQQKARGQTTGKAEYYTYSYGVEQKIAEMLYKLIRLQMENVTIELVGTWIWVYGDTRPHRDILGKNGLGLRWSGKRKKWYYSTTPYRRSRSRKSYDAIRQKYGSQVYQEEKATA